MVGGLQEQARPNVPELTRRERRKREVHERIVEAAVQIFDRQGFRATKIDEICAVADVAQKTFFNHFPTKQHLIGEIAEEFLDQLLAIVEEIRSEPAATRDRLSRFFQRVADEGERAGPMHKELILEVIRAAHAERSESKQTRRIQRSLRALIQDGVKAGDVTKAYSVDVLTEMVLGGFYSIMLSWVNIGNYPLRRRGAEAGRFLGEAITADR